MSPVGRVPARSILGALLVAIALSGCASPPVGTWDYDDGAEVMHLTLADNGKCVIVVGGYVGKFSEGFGGPCTYSVRDDIVSITAIASDQKGSMQPVSSATPIRFRIEPSGDIAVLNGKPRVLRRRETS
jgi:hypothetical protein